MAINPDPVVGIRAPRVPDLDDLDVVPDAGKDERRLDVLDLVVAVDPDSDRR